MDPTQVHLYPDGSVCYQSWKNSAGLFHRVDEPCFLHFYPDGKVAIEHWKINGLYHRVSYPAFVKFFENGKIHEFRYYNWGEDISIPVKRYLEENGLSDPFDISLDHSIIMKLKFW